MKRNDLLDVRLAFRTWLPAVAWSLMNIAASGDLLSARRTGGFVVWFLATFSPHLSGHWYDPIHTLLRKTGHFVNYAVVSWLWFRAARYWELRVESRAWKLSWALWGLAFAVATGICDEGLQHFVPSRTGNWMDVALDTTGALFAQMVILLVWRARRQPESAVG